MKPWLLPSVHDMFDEAKQEMFPLSLVKVFDKAARIPLLCSQTGPKTTMEHGSLWYNTCRSIPEEEALRMMSRIAAGGGRGMPSSSKAMANTPAVMG